MSVKTYVKGANVKLSENFWLREFDCKGKNCCDKTKIDSEGLERLQALRKMLGCEVKLSSAYRCPTHNKAVNGVEKSLHLKGMAFDIAVPKGITLDELAAACETVGFRGILKYENTYFVHADTRDNKYFAVTKNGCNFSPVTTFGGSAGVVVSVKEWQKSAISDRFSFARFGADGVWGKECVEVAKKAICKKRIVYKYKNLTKLVQKIVGFEGDEIDGKFGNDTKKAVAAWQKVHGLTADGVVGLNTWKKMLGV